MTQTTLKISKEANKELVLFKAEQELTNKSEAVLTAIAKARKFDAIKYSNPNGVKNLHQVQNS
jgi:hypothetical protein